MTFGCEGCFGWVIGKVSIIEPSLREDAEVLGGLRSALRNAGTGVGALSLELGQRLNLYAGRSSDGVGAGA